MLLCDILLIPSHMFFLVYEMGMIISTDDRMMGNWLVTESESQSMVVIKNNELMGNMYFIT